MNTFLDQEVISRDMHPATTLTLTVLFATVVGGLYLYDLIKKSKTYDEHLSTLGQTVQEVVRVTESYSDTLDEHDERIREKKGSDRYNTILDLDYEIKDMEARLSAKKKEVEMLKIKKLRYENQKNILFANGNDVTEITAQLTELDKTLETESASRKEIENDIRTKQDEMAQLRLVQVN